MQNEVWFSQVCSRVVVGQFGLAQGRAVEARWAVGGGIIGERPGAAWAGDKPIGVICVDNLITGRSITEEQLEALRLFAGYAQSRRGIGHLCSSRKSDRRHSPHLRL